MPTAVRMYNRSSSVAKMNAGSPSFTLTGAVYLLISLVVLITTAKPIDNTAADTQDLSHLLQRLESVLKVIERQLADKPEADTADEAVELEARAHRIPRPEVNVELAERSSVPGKDDALTRLITILEKQHTDDDRDDGIVSPITETPKDEDPLTDGELKRLLSILQKRDWDAPFPATGSERWNSHIH